MPVLRVKAGSQKGQIHELNADKLVLGRESTGDIQVLDQGVSRRHAEIFRIGELYFIQDLESRNGTFLNDQAIREEVLRFGDRIRIGNTSLVFEDRFAAIKESTRIRLADAGPNAVHPTSTIALRVGGDTSVGITPQEEESTESRSLNLLLAVDQVTSEEGGLARLLERVCQLTAKTLQAEHVYVFWRSLDLDSFDLLGRFDRESARPAKGGEATGVSTSILRDCVREGRAILSSDASLDGQFDGMTSVVMNQLRSVVCVPISVLQKAHGVLYAYANRAEAFSAEDLELVSAVGIQLGSTIGLLKMVRNSDKFFRTSIRTLVSAIEMRFPEDHGRSERIATYSLAIAKELGLTTHELRNAWLAGMLHGVGMIPLSDEERANAATVAAKKAANARKLLSQVPELSEVLPAIEDQAERWNGHGVPHGKKEQEIPLLARILGLAVELDRLLCSTEDGDEASLKETLLKLREAAGRQFDRESVNALLIAYRNGRLFNQDEEFFEIPMD